jgi:ABC-type uncharacterized transport system fused permease/ATPase subunit
MSSVRDPPLATTRPSRASHPGPLYSYTHGHGKGHPPGHTGSAHRSHALLDDLRSTPLWWQHTHHSPHEWHVALSPGQRQLLLCARIFVHLPSLVLLDEATSAMPPADEARIYNRLKALGIACVSFGHRASLEHHHDEVVDLSPREV